MMTPTAIAVLTAVGLAPDAEPAAAGASLGRYRDASIELMPVGATAGRTMDAEIVDVTGDGAADLILAGEFGPNTLLRRDGDRFEVVPYAFGASSIRDSEDIAVADVDGDGHADVIFATEDDFVDELLLGDGAGGFTDASDRLSPLVQSNAVLAADIDGDGDPDLLFGDRGPVRLLRNNGKGRFTHDDTATPGAPRITQDLELGDIDGDGDLDLLVANEDGNQCFLNDGKGNFRDVTLERLGIDPAEIVIPEETREVDLADVDGDGDLDLIFANVGWNTAKNAANRLLINDGKGWFGDESDDRLPDGGANRQTTLDADFADLDGDGDLDLVLANVTQLGSPPVQVWLNDGEGAFEDATERLVPPMRRVNAIDVEIADLNGDGRPDIYVANHVGADIILVGG